MWEAHQTGCEISFSRAHICAWINDGVARIETRITDTEIYHVCPQRVSAAWWTFPHEVSIVRRIRNSAKIYTCGFVIYPTPFDFCFRTRIPNRRVSSILSTSLRWIGTYNFYNQYVFLVCFIICFKFKFDKFEIMIQMRISRSIDVDWKKNGKDDFFSIPDFRLKKRKKGI